MNLLLNVVLFIRNNAFALKLSQIERIVLFTLAGRIGNNKNIWVRQTTLAKECLISKRYLLETFAILKEKKLITTEKKGRKLYYGLALEKVIHSSPIEERVVEEQVNPSSPIVDGKVNPSSPNRCTTVHLLNELSTTKTLDTQGIAAILETSKDTLKVNKKLKVKDKNSVSKDKKPSLILPEWLPQKDWNDYVQFRKEMRKPIGEIGQKRAITALTRFYETGQDISKIIDQSIVNGWQGLFPLRGGNIHANGQAARPLTHRQATTQRAWDVIKNWH